MTISHRTSILPRLLASGVPKSIACQLLAMVNHFVLHHGEEWTVARLKQFRVDYIRYLSGLSPVGTYRKRWVKTVDRSGNERYSHIPHGPIGYFWRRPVCKDSAKVALKALTLYRSFRATKPTPKQIHKFYGSVQRRSPAHVPSVDRESPFLKRMKWLYENAGDITLPISSSQSYYRALRPGPRKELEDWLSSPSRKAPGIELVKGGMEVEFRSVKKCEQDQPVRETLNFMLFSEIEAWWPLIRSSLPRKYEDYLMKERAYLGLGQSGAVFTNTLANLGIRMPGAPVGGSPKPVPKGVQFHVGTIGYIQEGGYKLRAVANPCRIFQWLLEPLGSTLFGLLRLIPWDWTWNQCGGVEVVKGFLESGEDVFSVDLSDATNNFPLTFQTEVLRFLFEESPDMMQLIDLFEFVARSPWVSPEGASVMWSVGQPLGLYPSFPCFALAHHVLLSQLNEGLGCEWAILGDDIVIRGRPLYDAYIGVMQAMDVPISWEKSLDSRRVCEFAGRLITKTGTYLGHSFSQITDDSFFDYCQELGPKLTQFLSRRQRRAVDLVAHLPEPLGFGWNPSGTPLVERLGNKLESWLRGVPITVSDYRKSTPPRQADLFDPDLNLSWSCHGGYRDTLDESPRPGGRNLPKDFSEVLRTLHEEYAPIGGNLSGIEFESRKVVRDMNGELTYIDDGSSVGSLRAVLLSDYRPDYDRVRRSRLAILLEKLEASKTEDRR